MWHIYDYTSFIYDHQIFGIYGQIHGYNCFRHMFSNAMLMRHYCWLCFLHIFAKMSGHYAHFTEWLCDLYLQCRSHICSVIHIKYMYTCLTYSCQIHGIYALFPGVCTADVAVGCALAHMQKCWVYMAILDEGRVIYNFNVVDKFGQ